MIIRKEISNMDTKKTILTRVSATHFESGAVDKEKLQAVAESGNYAPRFGEVQITVIENAEVINQIKQTTINMMKHSGNEFAEKQASNPEYDPVYNAPAIIVLSAPNGNDPQGFNMANVACASQNMLLMATELGLGSRYVMAPVMAFMNEEIAKQVNLPKDYAPLCMVLVGNANIEFVERSKDNSNINYVK